MFETSLSRATAPLSQPISVPTPRVCDAIGMALKGAFRGLDDTPSDLSALLSRLDRVHLARTAR